jgi:diguanylate cyclase (GGDEF)-like protein/PAS domain S-box-containing protein
MVSHALSESRTALAEAQELAHLGSFETDLVTGEMRWSAELYRILGVDPVRERPSLLYDFDHPGDTEHVARAIERARTAGEPFTIEHRIVTRDGRERYVFERGRFDYENGRPRRVIGAVLDITERKKAEERLRYLAEHDGLTGLPNRTLLRARLVDAMARAAVAGRDVGVLFVDLDRFKDVNDTIGHSAGDRLLAELARRLEACVGRRGTVARPGGDEFIIVLDALEDECAGARIARDVLETIGAPATYDGTRVAVSASVGLAVFPRDGTTPDELLRNADSAMYVAKARGGNAIEVYRPQLHLAALARLELERALHAALDDGALDVAFQPIVDARTGGVVAFEALARWTHDGAAVSPGDFVTLAEETGLIVRLGRFVLERACREARRLHDAGETHLAMAVNISTRQFRDADFTDSVRLALEAAALPPAYLQLEITESAYLGSEAELEHVEALSRLGVGLSIDDFGTGYSSLGYLKRLPVDALKIDRSFVSEILTDAADQAIVRAIIAVAQNLDLRVIAEGVETAEQAEYLRALGCTQLQGYYFARPLPAHALEAFLRQPSAP